MYNQKPNVINPVAVGSQDFETLTRIPLYIRVDILEKSYLQHSFQVATSSPYSIIHVGKEILFHP